MIIQDVSVEFDEASLTMDDPDWAKLKEIFKELEFRSMAQKMEPVKAVEPAFAQGTLFGAPEVPAAQEAAAETTFATVITSYSIHYTKLYDGSQGRKDNF